MIKAVVIPSFLMPKKVSEFKVKFSEFKEIASQFKGKFSLYTTRDETRPLNFMWGCYKIQTIEFSLVYSYVQKSTYRIDGVIAGIIVLDRAIKSGNTKAMRR